MTKRELLAIGGNLKLVFQDADEVIRLSGHIIDVEMATGQVTIQL